MGNLSKFGSGEQVFKDQIHNVLVSLLLHLVDPNPHVVKVPSSITSIYIYIYILALHSTTSNSLCLLSNVPRRASMPCEFVPRWWDQSRSQPCFRTTSTMTSAYITESLSTTSPSTWWAAHSQTEDLSNAIFVLGGLSHNNLQTNWKSI